MIFIVAGVYKKPSVPIISRADMFSRNGKPLGASKKVVL
jgi:hypothetical protein